MNEPAELYACLYAKEFPAQALLRLRPELHNQPCVVMEGEPPLQQVCSLNTKARLLGMEHAHDARGSGYLPSASRAVTFAPIRGSHQGHLA